MDREIVSKYSNLKRIEVVDLFIKNMSNNGYLVVEFDGHNSYDFMLEVECDDKIMTINNKTVEFVFFNYDCDNDGNTNVCEIQLNMEQESKEAIDDLIIVLDDIDYMQEVIHTDDIGTMDEYKEFHFEIHKNNGEIIILERY